MSAPLTATADRAIVPTVASRPLSAMDRALARIDASFVSAPWRDAVKLARYLRNCWRDDVEPVAVLPVIGAIAFLPNVALALRHHESIEAHLEPLNSRLTRRHAEMHGLRVFLRWRRRFEVAGQRIAAEREIERRAA